MLDFAILLDIILFNLVKVGKDVYFIMTNFPNSMYFGKISQKV